MALFSDLSESACVIPSFYRELHHEGTYTQRQAREFSKLGKYSERILKIANY